MLLLLVLVLLVLVLLVLVVLLVVVVLVVLLVVVVLVVGPSQSSLEAMLEVSSVAVHFIRQAGRVIQPAHLQLDRTARRVLHPPARMQQREPAADGPAGGECSQRHSKITDDVIVRQNVHIKDGELMIGVTSCR